MSFLEQDITKKGWINKFLMFEADNIKKYEVKAIQDRAVYVKKTNRHLLELYYLVA